MSVLGLVQSLETSEKILTAVEVIFLTFLAVLTAAEAPRIMITGDSSMVKALWTYPTLFGVVDTLKVVHMFDGYDKS